MGAVEACDFCVGVSSSSKQLIFIKLTFPDALLLVLLLIAVVAASLFDRDSVALTQLARVRCSASL